MIETINSLLFDKGNQLDRTRVFSDEVETSLVQFTAEKMTFFLADKFNIDLDPRMARHGYNCTLIQKNIGFCNKSEILSILKEFYNKNKETIIKEFVETDDYKRIEDKWAGYFKVVDNKLVFNDAWAQETHYSIIPDFEGYICKVGSYFNIDEPTICKSLGIVQ